MELWDLYINDCDHVKALVKGMLSCLLSEVDPSSPRACRIAYLPSFPAPSSLPTNVSIARFDPTVHLTNDPDQVAAGEKRRSSAELTCPQLPYARQLIDYGVRMTEALKQALPVSVGEWRMSELE